MGPNPGYRGGMRMTARLLIAVFAALILLPILDASAEVEAHPPAGIDIHVAEAFAATLQPRRSDSFEIPCNARAGTCCSVSCTGEWTELAALDLSGAANAAIARDDATFALSGTGPSAAAPPPKRAL